MVRSDYVSLLLRLGGIRADGKVCSVVIEDLVWWGLAGGGDIVLASFTSGQLRRGN